LSSTDKAAIVRQMLAAFMAQDRATAERLLADDFIFTSPYDDGIDRATWFERCWPSSSLFAEQEIERIHAGDDGAFVTYRVVRTDGVEFRNTEFFTFTGAQIASVNVYFGPSYKDGRFQEQK
jgi:ketosteroid isomerase-like protein